MNAYTPPHPEQATARVRAYADGRITLDGEAVSLSALRAAFRALSRRGGVVWYYREGGTEPHPGAMAAFEAIVEAQLPVSLSSAEDFSTVVLPDGTIRPRETE